MKVTQTLGSKGPHAPLPPLPRLFSVRAWRSPAQARHGVKPTTASRERRDGRGTDAPEGRNSLCLLHCADRFVSANAESSLKSETKQRERGEEPVDLKRLMPPM